MQTLTLILPKPHSAQRQIIAEARRFNVAACGRRFGKSTLGIDRAVHPALKGQPVGWFAPTYKIMLEVWHSLVNILQPVTRRSSVLERRIELVTGGILEFWTLTDNDAGRSRKYKRAIIDEAGLVPNLGEIWQTAIRPTLADLEGDAWLWGTPKGRNFFWQCYTRGQDPAQPDWQSWQLPTSANPYIKASEIEAMREMLTDRQFRQEVLAEFIDDAGGVFRYVRQRSTVQAPDPYPGDFVMGVDWGMQNDYTVLSVFDRPACRQVALDRFHQIDWAVQRGRLKALADRWQVQTIIAERNSIGGPNIEALQAEGLPVIAFDTTPTSKPPLIDGLALALERSDVMLLDDPVQISELEAYERIVSPTTGRSRYSAPEGMHDDTVMATALAWHGCQQSRLLVGFV